MKSKCPVCETGKARRLCWRKDDAEICSTCCAAIRSADCGECVHYAATLQHQENRQASALRLPAGKFMVEINPEVQETVNAALETAQRGGFEGAMETLTDLLRTHPHSHDIPFGIGVIHAMKGQHEIALTWFDRAIEIFPYSIESNYNKAVSHQKLLDLPNCIRSYQKVVSIGPASDPEVAKARSMIEGMAANIRRTQGVSMESFLRAGDRFGEAFKLMERGDWSGALKGFRASASLNDRSAPCHGNMGLCLAYLGRKAEALAELDRAILIDAGYQPARSNRKIVEKMTEGLPMANTQLESINFARESFIKNALE